ncbi:MAG: Gfo/Idh/MocA family oxidoreductase, partial [Chloroflexi bacterium]|nr:Gfo/Idh/MocA family oxidoreductase [Chloroflexota bacterium]
MSEQTVSVGLIGAGRIGRIHAENLATRMPTARLVSVADVVLQSAQEVGAQFGVPKIVEDYREILNDPEIHAVAIGSSTDTHAQIIQEAASAGKHIFCEKP